MAVLNYPKVYVGSAGRKGRGVFARKSFKPGDVIETSPYIEIPPRDGKSLTASIINSYWFEVDSKRAAIGLGLTSLYNHSETANAEFSINRRNRTISIRAVDRIQPKKEITINYGYSPLDGA